MTGTRDGLLQPVYRISVFCPPASVEALVEAVQRILPLGDGNYDSVHWVIRDVVEHFRPLPGAQPTEGRTGQLHASESVLLVFAIARDDALLERVLHEAIRPSHPWEEPAIFVDASFRPAASRG